MADAIEAQDLDAQRKRLFDLLSNLRGFYDRPEGKELLDLFMSRSRGESQPFGPDVVNTQLAQNAGAGGADFGTQREAILRSFAQRGLSGGGLELSALLGQQNRVAADVRRGRREITSRAQLENFAAQERAQAAASQFLAQQAAQQTQVGLQEADYRSRFHETGQAQTEARPVAGTPGRPTQFGLSNRSLTAPQRSPTSQHLGLLGSYAGPQGFYQQQGEFQQFDDMQRRYDQFIQQQALDRAELGRIQADWDARYGGR